MAIRFRCPCGAILNASDAHAESIKPCPHCHVNLRIPRVPSPDRDCAVCRKPIPPAHTIWARGRRVCWKCIPPSSVRLDMKAFREHRRLQLETIRKALTEGLHYFQYHAPYGAAHNEVQVSADEAVFHETEWSKITPAWRELGLIPFDMGSFMAVSLNVERFRAQADDSKQYLEPLLAFVKLADELPLASPPKES